MNEIPERDARVRFVHTDDPYTRLRPGDEGTAGRFTQLGGLSVRWDHGSTLSLLPDEGDQWEVLP